MGQQLSVIINVKNGAATIGRCLASLHKFTDIVVFDNYSSDQTIEIATAYPAVNIIQHEFCGMGKVRNLAATYAKNDWILFVDCDEALHPDLVNTILAANLERGSVYLIKRQNYFANLFVNSSSWENDWVKRLYNRNDTRFTENEVHESVEAKPSICFKKIDYGFIYHFPYTSVSQLIDKMQFYSTLYAKQNFNKKEPRLWMILLRAFFMFIKCYILKRGFMDGFAGFAISSYNAIGVFSKYIKLYELYNSTVFGLVLNLDLTDELTEIVTNINRQKLLPEQVYLVIKQHSGDNLYNSVTTVFHSLCMPFKIIVINTNDDLNNDISDNTKLDYLAYIQNNSLLCNKNLLKKYRKNITHNKQDKQIQLINLR